METPKENQKDVVKKKEAMTPPRRDRMADFSMDVLKDIDLLISQGKNANYIRKWIFDHFKGTVHPPDVKTIRLYIKKRLPVLNKNADTSIKVRRDLEMTEKELHDLYARLQVVGQDMSNKKALLERIVNFLLYRVELMSRIQENTKSPGGEQVIVSQLSVVHTFLQTILKLEGQLGANEFIARRIVEKFLVEFAPLVKKVVDRVCGAEKTKSVLADIHKELPNIDMNRLRKEAEEEAAAIASEDLPHAI
jgi:hypothetical protein